MSKKKKSKKGTKKNKPKQTSRWWVIPAILLGLLIFLSAFMNFLFPTPDIELGSQGHHPEYKSLEYGSNPGAPVTIVEFIDYQCPYCKEMHPKMKQLRKEFGSDINYVYIQAPNQAMHPQAPVAAVAAICAEQMEVIEQYSTLLFENNNNLEFNVLKELAEDVGLDPQSFHVCMADEQTKAKLEEDLFQGQVVNIRGTPTFFINGARLEGNQEFGALRSVIDAIINPDQ